MKAILATLCAVFSMLVLASVVWAQNSEPKVAFTLTPDPGPYEATSRSDAENDTVYKFRVDLLKNADFYRLDTAHSRGGLLIVQKGYLPNERLQAMATDIAEALERVPKFVGRPFFAHQRLAFYMYPYTDSSPVSQAGPFGTGPLKWGVRLEHTLEDQAPPFHELTHLTQTGWGDGSFSLDEGFADYVQHHFRPGQAFDFTPEGDPEELAAMALDRFPDDGFLSRIGADDFTNRFSGLGEKQLCYFASASFVAYLVDNGGMKKFVRLQNEKGVADAYRALYGKSLGELRETWRTHLPALTPEYMARR